MYIATTPHRNSYVVKPRKRKDDIYSEEKLVRAGGRMTDVSPAPLSFLSLLQVWCITSVMSHRLYIDCYVENKKWCILPFAVLCFFLLVQMCFPCRASRRGPSPSRASFLFPYTSSQHLPSLLAVYYVSLAVIIIHHHHLFVVVVVKVRLVRSMGKGGVKCRRVVVVGGRGLYDSAMLP